MEVHVRFWCWLAAVSTLMLSASPSQAQEPAPYADTLAWSPLLPRVLPTMYQAMPSDGRVLPKGGAGRWNYGHDDEQGGGENSEGGRLNERRFQPGKAASLSAGLALTGGVLAWLSKREADDAYDRYLHSAGSERQRTEFDRAERYDRLSGAAFAAMEAGVLLPAYFTFF